VGDLAALASRHKIAQNQCVLGNFASARRDRVGVAT
jgi:hypothetical protein